MQDKFFVHRNGQTTGPFTVDEIAQKVQENVVALTDYVYLDDRKDWIAIVEFGPVAEKTKTKKPAPPAAAPKTSAATNGTGLEAQEWYVLKWDNKYGPFSYIDIIKMLQSKSIFEFDYIWKGDFDTWKRIAEVDVFNHEKIKHHFETSKEMDAKNVFFRRRHERVTFNGSILIHDNNNVWKGEAIEISEEGAGITMNNAAVVPGQSIYLHFKPGDSVPPFNAVCEVVSKNYMKEVKTPATSVKYGVKFLKIQPGTKKAIKKYITEKAG